jgi:hypothetical protein
MVDESQKRREEAGGIQQPDGFADLRQLVHAPHIHQLIERSDATRQRDEGVGQLATVIAGRTQRWFRVLRPIRRIVGIGQYAGRFRGESRPAKRARCVDGCVAAALRLWLTALRSFLPRRFRYRSLRSLVLHFRSHDEGEGITGAARNNLALNDLVALFRSEHKVHGQATRFSLGSFVNHSFIVGDDLNFARCEALAETCRVICHGCLSDYRLGGGTRRQSSRWPLPCPRQSSHRSAQASRPVHPKDRHGSERYPFFDFND